MLSKEKSKPGIDDEFGAASVSEEVAALLDRRAVALAGDPNQKKFTLQEIFDRNNIK